MSSTRTLRIVAGTDGQANALRLPSYRLKVVKGPNKKREVKVSKERVLIGSAPQADLQLDDEAVSGLHCELVTDATGFTVRDLGSKNGVWLGGRRITEAWLADDDQLVVGQSVIDFKSLDDDRDVPLPPRGQLGRLRGSSAAMRALYGQLEVAAKSDAPVLLLGETGSGKELAAEALVEASPRRDGPLVVVDCGRLPITLAESELFGHERGAFTGAVAPFAGAFERAHRGTVFLDEIGDLPRELQPKLLGVVERGEVTRLGATTPTPIDVRVVAATHRDLPVEVNRGNFRADLFFRLAVLVVRVPRLRDHAEDIPELVSHFLSQMTPAPVLPPAALRRLIEGDYPGNVRELRAAVERAAVGQSPDVPPRPMPKELFTLDTPWRQQKELLIADLERTYLTAVLEACDGNITEASRRSGINRVHLHELIRRLAVPVPRKR